MKVLRFNPLKMDQLSFDVIESNLKVVDEFYISTEKGPIMAGEIWKDTEANRETIQKIIYQKQEFNRIEKEMKHTIYKLMNLKER